MEPQKAIAAIDTRLVYAIMTSLQGTTKHEMFTLLVEIQKPQKGFRLHRFRASALRPWPELIVDLYVSRTAYRHIPSFLTTATAPDFSGSKTSRSL
jgi:hypothetical protein